MNKSVISYFYGSIALSVVALAAGYVRWGFDAAWTIAILGVLEISLSFDNAVVNSSVLSEWTSHAWRNAFLWVGLPIAVFGMRLFFPILIVSMTTGLGMGQAFNMALERPNDYAHALMSAHHQVAAFGGTFLFMVALEYFLDAEKDEHWIEPIEKLFSRVGNSQVPIQVGIVLIVMLGTVSVFGFTGKEKSEFILASVFGLLTYISTKYFSEKLAGSEEAGKKVAQGIGGLIFLEVLDASFSFDGVIGAFAISNNLFIIMIGLGIGALFVRSLTIFMVDRGTLDGFKYLEHGAFWAILSLAIIMFVGIKVEIPDWFTGLIGAAFIGSAVVSSIRFNRAEERKAALIPNAADAAAE